MTAENSSGEMAGRYFICMSCAHAHGTPRNEPSQVAICKCQICGEVNECLNAMRYLGLTDDEIDELNGFLEARRQAVGILGDPVGRVLRGWMN